MTPMPMLKAAALTVEDLSVRYGTKIAVDKVSFRVEAGDALGIVGESGSGKSTAAMAAVGLLDPEISTVNATRLSFGNVDLQAKGNGRNTLLGRRIGIVFQNPMVALNPVLTIERQLTDHMHVHLGLTRDATRKRAIRLLDEVGISDAEQRLDSYPFQFSGGMLQRITIAMALACDPELLIADEPTTALDATVQGEVVDLILSIRESRGLSLIWITHDLALLNRVANRVAVMYAGRLVEVGPADVVLDHPSHPYTEGLLDSVRSLWRDEGSQFQTIEGIPPQSGADTEGCAFAPRCPKAHGRCTATPPLFDIPGQYPHLTACWLHASEDRQ